MSTTDIILFVVLGVGAVSGYRRGLIMELVSILALVLGIFLGLKLLYFGVEILRDQFNISGQLLPYISFSGNFCFGCSLNKHCGKIVKETIHMTFFGSFDRIGGVIFGVLKWAFAVSLFIWISKYVFPDFLDTSTESVILSKIEPIAPFVVSYFTSLLPILDDIFKEDEGAFSFFGQYSFLEIYSMMKLSIKEDSGFRYIDEGSGSVLLLIHGLFGALSNWEAVVEHFSKDHRVVIPLLPIYEMPIRQADLDGLVKFLDEFILLMRLNDLTLIGNSLGGHIGLIYTLNFPQNVKTLVLTGSSGLFENAMGGSYPRRGSYDYIKERVEYTFYNPETAG